MASSYLTPSQTQLIVGIKEVLNSYKTLQNLGLKNQDPGFVIKHLARIFDDPNRKVHYDGNKTIQNIRKVYEIFKTLSKWDTEGAPEILIENLIEVLEQENSLPSSSLELSPKEQKDEGSNSGQVSSTTCFSMPNRKWECAQNQNDFNFVQGAQMTEISNMENLSHPSSSSSFVQFISSEKTHLSFPVEKEKECKIPSFSCNHCLEPFETSVSLKQHIQLEHSSYSCILKREDFSSFFTTRNNSSTTTTKPEFSCPYCNKQFDRNYYLVNHIRVHTGERPFRCNICGSRFTQSGSLKKHRLIHERDFPCRHCSLTFYQEELRDRHELKHGLPKLSPVSVRPPSPPSHSSTSSSGSSDSDSMDVQYSNDDEQVEDEEELNSGLDQEEDEDFEPAKLNRSSRNRRRIRSCPHCQQIFKSTAELVTHVVTHTNERPFKCTFLNCIAAFKKKYSLREHEKRHKEGKVRYSFAPRNRKAR